VAGELRVDRLVRPGTQLGGPLDADNEVDVTKPSPVGEHRLVDDVPTRAHRGRRLLGRALNALEPATRLDLDDVQAAGMKMLEKAALVLEALTRRQRDRTIAIARRPCGISAHDLALQPHQPRTRHEGREIRRGENQPVSEELHGVYVGTNARESETPCTCSSSTNPENPTTAYSRWAERRCAPTNGEFCGTAGEPASPSIAGRKIGR
jgi:hypothetical protein